MPPPSDDVPPPPARLLKAAALLFALVGGGMTAWGLDKWIRFPEARASQFGFQAPLWPAFTIFVVFATGVVILLFWRAARRVEEGEDLFAQRHRRSPPKPDDAPDGGTAPADLDQ